MYGVLNEDEHDSLAACSIVAFAGTRDRHDQWLDYGGPENVRRILVEGRVGAALLDIPMGMAVGGRWVTDHGVSGVAVLPELRGRGLGRRLMSAYLAELFEGGVALSSLYASTRGLYRSVGYGIAGTNHLATLPVEVTRGVSRSRRAWRLAEEADWPAIEALYRELARWRPGYLDRGSYLWRRIRRVLTGTRHTYVLDGAAGLDGWVVLQQDRGDPWVTLTLADHGVRDAEALEALLSFVGGFSSIARTLKVPVGGRSSFLDRLPEHRVEVTLVEPTMVRVVDVAGALEQRGYAPGLSAALHLEVEDPVLPGNQGRFVVRVAGGRACVEPGGDGTIGVHVCGLAGLFTGYASPWELRSRGLLTGSDEGLVDVAAVFAGAAPGTPDFF